MVRYFSVVFLSIIFAGACLGATYPEKPVTVYVAFTPGGSMDLTTRALCAAAEKFLGQQIIIENKPGGGGTVAPTLVSTARPDGYLLCAATSTGIIRAPHFQSVSFKPLASFTPIVAFASPQNATCVRKDSPFKTHGDLIEYAKKNPGKVKYSSAGVGTAMHHAMEYVKLKEKVEIVHVPYTGSREALVALLGGHVDVCSSGPEHAPYVRSGEIRALAYHQSTRNPKNPDVPTLKELGYDFVNETVFSILGPAGMPDAVVKKLEDAFRKAKETPEFKRVLDNLDMIPVFMGHREYSEYLKTMWFKIEKSLKETGLLKESATKPY